jgi:glycosyltransferase involved in cell wall biosynthesis
VTSSPRLAVAIPCHNEAAAIAAVITDFRAALPDAEILVLDNNSTDGTGDIARNLGARVIPVPEQGKGHVVRRAFAELAEADVVVLVDGDGTYPADHVQALIAPVWEGRADMSLGARRPVAQAGAMTPVRGLGNLLIRLAFATLMGRGQGDLLTGYRAFSKPFRAAARLRSSGFEIETELACEAVAAGVRVVEVPVPYYPRIAGTTSKLKAFRDGRRILAMIVGQSLRRRPWRPLLLVAGVLALMALPLRSWPLGLCSVSCLGAAGGLAARPNPTASRPRRP